MAAFRLLFVLGLTNIVYSDFTNMIDENVLTTSAFVFWPNATIPFFIDPDNFDHEQALAIMTALANFSFKSCLKFLPVLARPRDADHVLVLENPAGVRKCYMNTEPHSVDEPHGLVLGYECLKSPDIDMIIMKSLGFPFEHNRAVRDLYVSVQEENIEPGYMELFNKDIKLPLELRSLPYDHNSVMHFGERDFSKNGHRTLMFKIPETKQERTTLTPLDLRKIEIVYGPECRKRDRLEKIELCQNYPGVARKKRDTLSLHSQSLRVNPDIIPILDKPEGDAEAKADQGYADAVVAKLSIEKEVEDLVEQVHKVAGTALEKAREKYCNVTKPSLRAPVTLEMAKPKNKNILGIIDETASYAKYLVDSALKNLTEFCRPEKSIDDYQRSCPFFDQTKCRKTYKSTKSGPVKYSTQHRPIIKQSTKHKGVVTRNIYDSMYNSYRSGNNTEEPVSETADEATTTASKRKREADASVSEKAKETTLDGKTEQPGLRMGTKLPPKKNRYDPNYRSISDTEKAERRKRETDVAEKETEDLDERNAHERRFKSQRYRANKHFMRWQKEARDWDNSGVSLESINVRAKKHGREGRRGKKKAKRNKKSDNSREGDEVIKKKTTAKLLRPPLKDRRPGPVPRTVPLSKKNKEFYEERIWPDNVVRYIIKDDGNFDMDDVKQRLNEVNKILKKKTCVSIDEITEDDAENYEDYLVLNNSPDYVTGKVGGKQEYGVMELLRGGQHRQHAAMMVMAMLGFYFEVARHDRDKHIRVHMRHVRPDKLHHFEKIREDATFPLPYDYDSATHPAWQFWRQIGRSGISTVATFKGKDPDGHIMKSLGQHEQLLSDLDLVKINSVYGTDCFTGNGENGGEGERGENETDERKTKETDDKKTKESD